jgi:hypothetical protein
VQIKKTVNANSQAFHNLPKEEYIYFPHPKNRTQAMPLPFGKEKQVTSKPKAHGQEKGVYVHNT